MFLIIGWRQFLPESLDTLDSASLRCQGQMAVALHRVEKGRLAEPRREVVHHSEIFARLRAFVIA